jgi:hypothetical protein
MGIEKKWLRCRTIIPDKNMLEFMPEVFIEKFIQHATISTALPSTYQNKLKIYA